jgi:N-acetylglucosamine malate deacetylase 1
LIKGKKAEMNSKENILILAPHTDDGELGCGATIFKYSSLNRNLVYLAFSTCEQSLPQGAAPDSLVHECRKATGILGINDTRFLNFEVRKFPAFRQEILEAMVKINKELNPHTVFLPAKNDVHQDHHVIYEEGIRAFKNSNLLGYELPWNNTGFCPNYFETMEEGQLSEKIRALKEYKTQAHRNYMDEGFIRSLAIVRGVQCNSVLAEAFEVYRMKD